MFIVQCMTYLNAVVKEINHLAMEEINHPAMEEINHPEMEEEIKLQLLLDILYQVSHNLRFQT